MKLATVASALLSASVAAQPLCPTYVRMVHTLNPSASVQPIDVYVNGKLQYRNVPFRGVGDYIAIPPGTTEVAARTAGSPADSQVLSLARFAAAPNQAYTVGFTGPVTGPAGQQLSNSAPFVNPDQRLPPSPNRITGLWYRWSETNLAIDFRAVAGMPPDDVWAIGNATDLERIANLAPKTVMPYGEIYADGSRQVSFYPVLQGSTAPLFNTVRNEFVRINGLRPQPGKHYDIIATGDTLGANHMNSLALVYTETTTTIDPASGCTLIVGAGGIIGNMNGGSSGFDQDARDKQQTILGLVGAAVALSAACFLLLAIYVMSKNRSASDSSTEVELAARKQFAPVSAAASVAV